MSHAPASSIANLRDMFRPSANKIPPDLRRALTHLNLTSLTDLEERFLGTTAFFAPWTVFRDSCLLVSNTDTTKPSAITRLDILWFYTQFDEDLRRHDPRTLQSLAYFEIDKSGWGPAEHEKHLYAWLLQVFCVGKAYSPFGFRYLELRSICTAWEEVFVPILQAVRVSYSVKGRRHYGRLALFIEERCPSRLAFPEGNVSMPNGVVDSPTPFRMVSRPTRLRGTSQTVLTKKNYEEAERELRDVYPQYGGLVERPIFKQKMDEWLEVQRVRAAHRKAIVKPDVVQYVPRYQPQVVQQSEGNHNYSPNEPPSKEISSRSPIKRYSDSIRRSLSKNVGNSCFRKPEPQSPLPPTPSKTTDTPKTLMIPYGSYSYVPKFTKEEPKSPLHGVTRQIHIPDDVPDQVTQQPWSPNTAPQELPDNGYVCRLPATRLPCPKLPKQRPSEQSLYTTVRNSDLISEATLSSTMLGGNSEDCIWSLMGAQSAVLPPLKRDLDRYDDSIPQSLLEAKGSYPDVRHPSYEGNGYHEEISLTNLHARKVNSDNQSVINDREPFRPRSRLPAPIEVPPPYVSHLCVASNEIHRNDSTSNAPSAPRLSEPPRSVAWPGFEELPSGPSQVASTLAPPIPAKSPERWASRRGQKSEQLLRKYPLRQQNRRLYEDTTSHEISRIVSKESIRAALGKPSPESSTEDLGQNAAQKAPARVASPPRLQAYNTHMFPRKDVRANGPS